MTGTDQPSLADQGYRMPPEWHPHSALWLAWPHNEETWPANLLEAQGEFLQLVSAIAEVQPVVVIAPESCGDELLAAWRLMPKFLAGGIQLENIATNDAWMRDYGPTFVINENTKGLAAIDWHYNAWGGKYPPYDDDQKVAQQIVHRMPSSMQPESGCCYVHEELCVEGGALEINEDGVLLCTRSSIVNANRNPAASIEQVELNLKSNLGAEQVIWLSGDTASGPALLGDDTDAHIDQLARFVPGGAVVHSWTDDETDAQYLPLKQNLEDLQNGLSAARLDYRLVPLPLPDPVEFDGSRLPATYCNFCITNRSVIVPQFNQPQDPFALDTLRPLFPGRQVIGLPSTNLSVGLGSFHCLTQQQPQV